MGLRPVMGSLGAAGVVLLALTAPTAHAHSREPAAVPDSAGYVIPTQLDTSAPSLQLVSGSDLGVTWTKGAYPTGIQGGYRLLDQPASVSTGRADVVLAGHTRYVSQGIPYAPTDTWTGTDLDTGQSWPAITTSNGISLVGFLPHAALLDSDQGQLMISRQGGAPEPIDTGPLGLPVDAAGDDAGVLLSWHDTTGGAHTGWVSLTGTPPAGGYPVAALPVGNVRDTKPGESGLVSVSPRTFAYQRADGTVVRYDRDTMDQLDARVTSGSVLTVVTTDNGLGWENAGAPNLVTTCAEPAGACATVSEAGQLPTRTDEPPALNGIPDEAAYVPASGLVAVGTDFAISTGVSRDDRAVRLLTPGAVAANTEVDDTGPSAPYSVSLAPGRLIVDLGYENYEQSLTVSPVGAVAGPVTAVSAQELDTNIRPAVSGSRTAIVLQAGSTNTLQVDDGGTVVARWTGLPYAGGSPSFSGDRLVLPVQGFSLMFSVGNPAAAPVRLPAQSVLFGDRIVYPSSRSGIMLRDLSKPGAPDTVLKPDGGNAQVVSNVQLQGDWLLYAESDYDNLTATVVDVADHLTPSGSIDRSLRLPGETPSVAGQALLESGFVAVIESDLSVHLFDLTDGSDTVVGQSAVPADNGWTLGASDDAIVWVADDLRVHVLPIGGTSTAGSALSGPQLLGVQSLPPATVPVTVAVHLKKLAAAPHLALAATPAVTVRRSWVARVDSTRPLTAWTFTLRDASHRLVLRRSGRAPRGTVTVTWNGTYRGRRDIGKATWTVTGVGPGGRLHGRDGRVTTAEGTFTVKAAKGSRLRT